MVSIHLAHILGLTNFQGHIQPTEFEMRQRNAKFANDVRAGKTATRPSRQDKLAHRSPLSLWALGVIVFVVMGGGVSQLLLNI